MKKQAKNLKKSQGELQSDLNEKMIALRNSRFNVAGSKSKNVKEYAATRKDIARIHTILNKEKNNG